VNGLKRDSRGARRPKGAKAERRDGRAAGKRRTALEAENDRGDSEVGSAAQLRKAAQSISANISEGFGRGAGPERNHALRVARGEAEEAIRHLRANFAANRIEQSVFWRFRNRLVTIIKMLTSLLKRVA
jgi:four helix bundle protein